MTRCKQDLRYRCTCAYAIVMTLFFVIIPSIMILFYTQLEDIKNYAIRSDLVLFQNLVVCFGVYFLVPAEEIKRKMLHTLLIVHAITLTSSNRANLDTSS